MYMPVGMPYKKVLDKAKANFNVNEDIRIVGENKIFRRGWIRASLNNPKKNLKTIKK